MITGSLSDSATTSRPVLDAAIGVWFRQGRTFYVRRSEKMKNYPGAWSLFSIQFDPHEFPDPMEERAARSLMEGMANERLYGAPVVGCRFLTASTCTKNPINTIVRLRLYAVTFDTEPALNPDYYSDGAWMTSEEYAERRGSSLCGSCIRMWSDYCLRTQIPNSALANSGRVVPKQTRMALHSKRVP